MLLIKINKKDILRKVEKSISEAKSEIVATMLLREEIKHPLPASYFNLLKKRVENGIILKRLGFGKKEDYNIVKKKLAIRERNYFFRYYTEESQYQRLIIIDRKILFLGVDGLFFKSKHKPLIEFFLRYFYINFKKGKI